ncbi:hypothetical protein CYMTET_55942 [Cymbomonas tetramitiformis]|uniref:Coenzyme Q-binding protein COQ10 START domain-containing protein n=1 Tax=Cymbomonas tetramitiformis TaxID=36881 RepID=A0AAE0BCA0_9CHLO|nr:hypothetical protein CYMTET_55942 [Cymbomonas tetramitiformis]
MRIFESSRANGISSLQAETVLHASESDVWAVLTDYDRLHKFVPNLESSERLPNRGGKILLKQVGASKMGFIQLRASAVLEIEEREDECRGRQLLFNMVEGDFKSCTGRWTVHQLPGCTYACTLLYEIEVAPSDLSISAAVAHRVLRDRFSENIQGICKEAERRAAKSAGAFANLEVVPTGFLVPGPSKGERTGPIGYLGLSGVALPGALPPAPRLQGSPREMKADALPFLKYLPEKATVPAFGEMDGAVSEVHFRNLDTAEVLHRRVVTVVRIGAPAADVWSFLTNYNELAKHTPALLHSKRLQPPAATPTSDNNVCAAHCLHRPLLPVAPRFYPSPRLIVAVVGRVEGREARSSGKHWLHKGLASFKNRLGISTCVCQLLQPGARDIRPQPGACASAEEPQFQFGCMQGGLDGVPWELGGPGDQVRVRQVVGMHLPYMTLQAEAVLDILEKNQNEIQFRSVQGDFDVLQGKWLLQQEQGQCSTLLKYAVEVIIARRPEDGLQHLEPLIEQVAFEDLPANMVAIRDTVEEMRRESLNGSKRRRSLANCTFEELKAELEKSYGGPGVMPRRAELRQAGRVDLEKAITAAGGFPAVANKLGWRLAYKERKPRGYWTSLANVRLEIENVIEDLGTDPEMMPTRRELEGAGRYDILRAMDKWGGSAGLASALGLQTQGPRKGKTAWNVHVSEVRAKTGLKGRDMFQEAARTYQRPAVSSPEK